MKIFLLFIFSLILALACAAYLLILISRYRRARAWQEVQATILQINDLFPESGASRPRFRKIELVYEYEFQGKKYKSSQVALIDDVGFFVYNKRLHARLMECFKMGSAIKAFVDDGKPKFSVLSRDLSSQEILASIFFLLLGLLLTVAVGKAIF